MKITKKVKFSTYSMVLSALTLAVLAGVALVTYRRTGSELTCWIFLGIMVVWCAFALWFAPVKVSFDGKNLKVYRTLRVKRIATDEIKSVAMCPPTMGEKRLIGSGGFLGYWGWFSERDLGRYFSYRGKSSDAFLVTLKNGRKYMLGCEDAPEVVDAVRASLGDGK